MKKKTIMKATPLGSKKTYAEERGLTILRPKWESPFNIPGTRLYRVINGEKKGTMELIQVTPPSKNNDSFDRMVVLRHGDLLAIPDRFSHVEESEECESIEYE